MKVAFIDPGPVSILSKYNINIELYLRYLILVIILAILGDSSICLV